MRGVFLHRKAHIYIYHRMSPNNPGSNPRQVNKQSQKTTMKKYNVTIDSKTRGFISKYKKQSCATWRGTQNQSYKVLWYFLTLSCHIVGVWWIDRRGLTDGGFVLFCLADHVIWCQRFRQAESDYVFIKVLLTSSALDFIPSRSELCTCHTLNSVLFVNQFQLNSVILYPTKGVLLLICSDRESLRIWYRHCHPKLLLIKHCKTTNQSNSAIVEISVHIRKYW